jgi:hypothetical protein
MLLFAFRLYRLHGGRALGVFDEARLIADCIDFLVRTPKTERQRERECVCVCVCMGWRRLCMRLHVCIHVCPCTCVVRVRSRRPCALWVQGEALTWRGHGGAAQTAYVGMLGDAKKNERDLSIRAFLVVLILQELTALPWEDDLSNKVRQNAHTHTHTYTYMHTCIHTYMHILRLHRSHPCVRVLIRHAACGCTCRPFTGWLARSSRLSLSRCARP